MKTTTMPNFGIVKTTWHQLWWIAETQHMHSRHENVHNMTIIVCRLYQQQQQQRPFNGL